MEELTLQLPNERWWNFLGQLFDFLESWNDNQLRRCLERGSRFLIGERAFVGPSVARLRVFDADAGRSTVGSEILDARVLLGKADFPPVFMPNVLNLLATTDTADESRISVLDHRRRVQMNCELKLISLRP